MPSDERQLAGLLERFRRGDVAAFEALLPLVTPLINTLISRLIRNHADAQDAAQEIAIELYRALPRYRGDCAVSTYVYRVAFNICLRCRKRLDRNPLPFTDLTAADDDAPAVDFPAPVGADPAHAAVSHARLARLHAIILHLPPQFCQAFILRDVLGFSLEESAGILACPVDTVKTRLHRARKALQQQIRDERELFGGMGTPI
jgi:RNA polymerase sigma-70 factor (ECF subfamily)